MIFPICLNNTLQGVMHGIFMFMVSRKENIEVTIVFL